MKDKLLNDKVEKMIESLQEQNDTLKEIADFLCNKAETTKMVVSKNENELAEIRKDYEKLGARIRALEEYAAMYNCWGYHE